VVEQPRGKYAAMRARSREQTPPLPGWAAYFALPPLARRWAWVQQAVAGVRTRLTADGAEMTLPNGDILCCGGSCRDRHLALKTYFYVGYLGQYTRRRALQAGEVVLDLGANLGCFMLPAARVVAPTGRVYCIEPVPENLGHLRRTVAANGLNNVTVIPQAVGAERGVTRLNLCPRSGGHSALFDYGGDTVDVPTTTVDDLVAELGLGRVDFVKMDVEGMETEVLRGAARTLRAHRPHLCMAGYHRPGDVTELPGLLREIEPSYECESDHPAWAELDIHAWSRQAAVTRAAAGA